MFVESDSSNNHKPRSGGMSIMFMPRLRCWKIWRFLLPTCHAYGVASLRSWQKMFGLLNACRRHYKLNRKKGALVNAWRHWVRASSFFKHTLRLDLAPLRLSVRRLSLRTLRHCKRSDSCIVERLTASLRTCNSAYGYLLMKIRKTPKALNNSARGREAHPGTMDPPTSRTLKGFNKKFSQKINLGGACHWMHIHHIHLISLFKEIKTQRRSIFCKQFTQFFQ